MQKESVLVLGAKGMLGQALVAEFAAAGHDVTAWDREDVDVTDAPALAGAIAELWPDVIINATAYNAVDLCETSDEEYAKARKLNADVPGALAEIAAGLQAVFVHYSTDYVFDGERATFKGGRGPGCCGSGCGGCQYKGPDDTLDYRAYREYDDPRPISRYGQTKRDGEVAVERNGSRYYIIRLSKLFGVPAAAAGAKRSFFDVMLEVGRKAEADGTDVKAVDSETSCFTYAPDLAAATRELVESDHEPGIYHRVNEDPCTWYEAVLELYRVAGITARVVPVAPDAFPRAARRPASSVLRTTKLRPLRSWRDALAEYLSS